MVFPSFFFAAPVFTRLTLFRFLSTARPSIRNPRQFPAMGSLVPPPGGPPPTPSPSPSPAPTPTPAPEPASPSAEAAFADPALAFELDKASFRTKLHIYALRVPPRLCHTVRQLLKPHLLSVSRVRTVLRPDTPHDGRLLVLTRHAVAPHDADLPGTRLDTKLVGRPAAVAAHLASQHRDTVAADSASAVSDATRDDNEQEQQQQQLRDGTATATATATENGKSKRSGKARECAEARKFIATLSEPDIVAHTVGLDYEHWPLDLALKRVLPPTVQAPTAFETIGHIAHVNLRDVHAPYRGAIGAVMLDKLGPRIRTIVNKTESTGGPYRTFAMEVLAGEHDLVAEVRENGCRFRLDFRAVYWNSRLEAEHGRVVDLFDDGEVIADAFCGVGPFAVPAAKRARVKRVYANDLNPASVKYLRENVKRNGVRTEMIDTSCGCAREFLKGLAKQRVMVDRVLMNFPSGAPEFLDVFRGLYENMGDTDAQKLKVPQVHCYCFVKGEDELQGARERVRTALFGEDCKSAQMALPDNDVEVRVVRDVAPKKIQVCVTFRVPLEVVMNETAGQPAVKRQKMIESE